MDEISLSTEKLEFMRKKWHPGCFACGGMEIKYSVSEENYLETDDKFCTMCGPEFCSMRNKNIKEEVCE